MESTTSLDIKTLTKTLFEVEDDKDKVFETYSQALKHNYLIESALQDITKDNENLRKAKLSNQFGSICLKADQQERAGKLFKQSIELFKEFSKT